MNNDQNNGKENRGYQPQGGKGTFGYQPKQSNGDNSREKCDNTR